MKITSDFHIHTRRSLCAPQNAANNAADYVAYAKRIGLTKIGFADHFWDASFPGANDFYKPQDFSHIATIREELDALRGEGISLFFGAEAEYDPYRHGVALSEEAAEQLDFVIVPNSHTHMMMPKKLYSPYEKHAEFMVNAFCEILESPVARYVTAIAHPFEAVCCPYDRGILINLISDDTFRRLFDRAAERNIAVELNISCLHGCFDEGRMRMFALAKECGCRFTFGSDDHAPNGEGHDYRGDAEHIAALLGLTEDDLAPITK